MTVVEDAVQAARQPQPLEPYRLGQQRHQAVAAPQPQRPRYRQAGRQASQQLQAVGQRIPAWRRLALAAAEEGRVLGQNQVDVGLIVRRPRVRLQVPARRNGAPLLRNGRSGQRVGAVYACLLRVELRGGEWPAEAPPLDHQRQIPGRHGTQPQRRTAAQRVQHRVQVLLGGQPRRAAVQLGQRTAVDPTRAVGAETPAWAAPLPALRKPPATGEDRAVLGIDEQQRLHELALPRHPEADALEARCNVVKDCAHQVLQHARQSPCCQISEPRTAGPRSAVC